MRLIVMAALTVGDELTEAAKRVRRLEEELTALQDARVASERTRAGDAGRDRGGAQFRLGAHRARDAQPQPEPSARAIGIG